MFVCNAGLGLSSPKEEFNFPYTYVYMLLLLGVSAAHLAPVVSPRVRPLELCAQAQKPFDGLIAATPEATLQDALRRDIGRRYSELTLLGWLGRLYLLAPFVFESLAPSVFRLETYENSAMEMTDEREVLLTLRESSVVARGIPFCLQLTMSSLEENSSIEAAALLGIGCDLSPAGSNAKPASASFAATLCESINRREAKQLVVRAIVAAIFGKLSAASAAISSETDVVACDAPTTFVPRQDLFAREGSSEKWLQLVSGYYFAASTVQETRFAAGAAPACTFAFYYDAAEPFNSDDPTRNVNPEVIFCSFAA